MWDTVGRRRDVIAFNAASSALAGARRWDLVQDAAGWAVDGDR